MDVRTLVWVGRRGGGGAVLRHSGEKRSQKVVSESAENWSCAARLGRPGHYKTDRRDSTSYATSLLKNATYFEMVFGWGAKPLSRRFGLSCA